ncbi:Ras GTPase-activating protein-binding protein 1 [Sciurus carolinensis]|uniref:Ras GTPase-activating protein-binding protein 1 n=1 Tax=Sciurus carolinensis TaxID=30640 RepID=A0AA41TBT2_SCICA|nr:Ras GTPase-activating protein-binding protein 1 [Sciurus carolinensis]
MHLREGFLPPSCAVGQSLFFSRSAAQVELTKAMIMEKPSPLLVQQEFVRQYYTLLTVLHTAPDMLHRFYGKNPSYVRGGLDSNGKPAHAVYRQKEIQRKVMSQNFTNCHTNIRHVEAHATLNDGVMVQVMGLLSNNNQTLRRFMQTFVLAPEGSVANKFYVHNDQTAELVPDDSGMFYDQAVSNDLEEHLEETVAELEPDPEPEPEQEPVSEIQEEKSELVLEEPAPEDAQKSSPAPTDIAQTRGPRPIREAIEVHISLMGGGVEMKLRVEEAEKKLKLRVEQKLRVGVEARKKSASEGESRVGEAERPKQAGNAIASEQGDVEAQRIVRHLGSHQLFTGNLPHEVDKSELKDFFQNYGNVVELCINNGRKLPNFGFVVFDDSEPVQKFLSNRPITFREVRLNVEEKTRAVREGDRRDDYLRGPGGPRGGLGGGMSPPRGGMVQKPRFGVGRGIAPRQ